MAKYNDCGYSFLMSKIIRNEDGTETMEKEIDIEGNFQGLVYKQCSGLEAYGKPRPYEETYAESDEAYVHIAENAPRDQTNVTLTLYFFDAAKHKVYADSIKSIDDVYHSFMDYLSNGKIIYRDTARKRKVKIYLSDSTDPKIDSLYGKIYKEVEFKFKNVYGRSFSFDATLPSVKQQDY